MADVPEIDRTFDLKKPPGHQVAIPRWTLKFPRDVTHVYTLYIGVQCRDHAAANAAAGVEHSIQELLVGKEGNKPAALDSFHVTEGFDVHGSRAWTAYWTSGEAFHVAVKSLDLQSMWRGISAGEERRAIGLWLEHFTTPLDRLETNYAGLETKPGLAAILGTEQPEHDLTGYWGAGRDRIRASAQDKFHYPADSTTTVPPRQTPEGVGQVVRGTNYENMCHIRSGQYWHTCGPVEREAYEADLEPALMEGMRYLWQNATDTGTLGLRFLHNLDREGELIRETCGAGFFRNWADQERWSSRDPSHLRIYSGSVAQARRFGRERKFMTWHEVSILEKGAAQFEYVNCAPETGVIKWVPGLHIERL